MPAENWQDAVLGDLLREPIRNGYSPNCPSEPTGRWILSLSAVTHAGFNTKGVKPAPPDDPQVAATQLEPGDLVVSRSNTRERVGLAGIYRGIPAPCSYPDLLMRIRTRAQLDIEFLCHLLLSRAGREYFQRTARGTSGSMVKIDRALLERFPLPLPPFDEQRKIAAILASVDEAIEATQAVIEQLQVVKKAMMGELLTRGLPGRHTRFKQTEIGYVPVDWSVRRMGELAAIGNGSTPSRARADYWDAGTIPWLPTGKVNDRVIDAPESFVTEMALAECPIQLLPAGTLLVAMIGQGKTRGKVAYLAIPATINQNFAYIRPSDALRSWFLFFVLDHQYEALRADPKTS